MYVPYHIHFLSCRLVSRVRMHQPSLRTFLVLFSNSFVLYQPFPKQALVFTCLQYKSFEKKKKKKKTVGKGENARNEQFLLYPQCFLPV